MRLKWGLNILKIGLFCPIYYSNGYVRDLSERTGSGNGLLNARSLLFWNEFDNLGELVSESIWYYWQIKSIVYHTKLKHY